MRKKARKFQDLLVWQKAHLFVLGIYKFTNKLPKYEQFGLINQLRRSSVSIPANIVEGFRKRGKADKARYMNIAQASLEESRYYLILIRDLEYCNVDEYLSLVEEISKLLDSYTKRILSSDL